MPEGALLLVWSGNRIDLLLTQGNIDTNTNNHLTIPSRVAMNFQQNTTEFLKAPQRLSIR